MNAEAGRSLTCTWSSVQQVLLGLAKIIFLQQEQQKEQPKAAPEPEPQPMSEESEESDIGRLV